MLFSEVTFVFVLALIYLLVASIKDIKDTEIPNWISFSLVVFIMGFRFFYSLFSQGNDWSFFLQGLVWLGIFVIFGNLFYYGRFFAGGDAKLFMALGPLIAFTGSFNSNLNLVMIFILAFLFTGALYGLIWSFYYALKNFGAFKKEFKKQVYTNKNSLLLFLVLIILFFIIGLIYPEILLISLFLFIFLFLFLFAKTVDKSCMVKDIPSKDLREGDWLYKDIHFSSKTITASWEGLSRDEINYIQKNSSKKRKITIRNGIPFVPVFLISYIFLLIACLLNLNFFPLF